MATRHPHTGTPSRLHSLIEWRALAEMAVLPFTWPALARLPHGDGHPVLLLPGFMADEGSLFALKAFLAGRGYAVETWGLGRNTGFRGKLATALPPRAATDPAASAGEYFGPNRFFEMNGPPERARLSRNARDESVAARLWTTSETLTGIHYGLPAGAAA